MVGQITDFEATQQRAHAAGDVKPDTASRHNPTFVRIKGRNAADRVY